MALISKYTYYGCTRARNKYCELTYIRENDLIEQLRDLVDSFNIDELGVRGQYAVEVDRMFRFHRDVIGEKGGYETGEDRDLDVKAYVKYLLREGSIEEKASSTPKPEEQNYALRIEKYSSGEKPALPQKRRSRLLLKKRSS